MKFFVCLFLTAISIYSPLSLTAAEHTKDSLDKVRELIAAKKAMLVDVREKVEWDAGHIEGSKWVPMSKLKGTLSNEQLREHLPADKVIYLYCAGGSRLLSVAQLFEDQKLQLRPLKQGYQTLLNEGFSKALPEESKSVKSGQ